MSELSARVAQAPSRGEHFPCALPTTCQPPLASGGKEGWPALITELSNGGLSLTLKRRFERGAGLAIELPGEDGPSTVLARVVQIKPHPGTGWELSCSLISQFSDEELQALLAIDQARRAATAPVTGVLFQVALRPGHVLRWF